VVRAGQAAAYAAQLYSLVLTTGRKRHPFNAPLLFTVCVDLHKMGLIMKRRGWRWASNDLYALLLGAQDAAYMAQNMILAAESLGLGTCLLGGTPYQAETLAIRLSLPPGVFPLVQLAMGYPAEDPPARPRYPMDFVLFKNRYPRLGPARVRKAMNAMDRGFLKQGYYRKARLMLPLTKGRMETHSFDNYSWTEHQSRKWGQWNADIRPLLSLFEKRGFHLMPPGAKRRK
jgi:nitroreductase